MKGQILLGILLILCVSVFAQPSISGFTPGSGPVGTTVIINGSGFNSTPTNNIVYFGPTKAAVTAATSTQLTVTVPVGTTYQPITVLTNGLIAYSRLSFSTTYPGWGAIDANTFTPKKDFATGGAPYWVALGDFDGDGKTDMAVTNSNATYNSVSILRNTGTGVGVASFAARVDFHVASTPYGIVAGDLDGDGKLDLAVANNSSNTVSVLLNTSTGPGSVSFAAKSDFAAGTGAYSVAAGDLDGDGRTDLAILNRTANTISLLRNTSTGTGSVGFAPKIDYATDAVPYSVTLGDLDGDGKQDMVIANANNSPSVSTFRNTSTGTGSISFAAKVDYVTGSTPRSVEAGDLDGDGKLDLAVGDYGAGVSILRSTSTGPGAVSFAAKSDYAAGALEFEVTIGDLDGDGKPDLLVPNYSAYTVSVLRNTNTGPGSINYSAKVSYATGSTPMSVAIGDFDGDGKADIAAVNDVSYTVSVYLHQADQAITFNVPSLNYGDTYTLSATNSSGLPLTYTSSNLFVGKINGNVLTIVGAGVVTITVSQAGNANFRAASVSQTITINPTPKSVIDLWAFQYRYDGRKRMTAKKVPGADWVYMVYDIRDRLVLTQDGNQRANNQWTFTKYDALNRPVSTGIYTTGSTIDLATMQANVNNYYSPANTNPWNWYESFSTTTGNVHNYDNKSFPQVTDQTQYLTVTYFDDNTSIQTLWGTTYSYTSDNLVSGSYIQQATDFRNVTGHPVAGKIKLIDGSNTWLRNITYYDDHYRVIQTVSDNIKGGTDRSSNLYDFIGRVLTTKTTHHTSTHSDQIVARSFNYDHASRLLQTWHSVNGATPVLLAANDYNELGQLVTKKLYSTDGSSFRQNVDHRYNIRGWLTRINDSDVSSVSNIAENANATFPDLFGMNLIYEQSDNGLVNIPQFNGNISAVKWSNNSSLGLTKNTAYNYTYDTLNRIKSSSYMTNPGTWTPSSNFAESGFSYDLNGNIRKLTRTSASGSSMDLLKYDYVGQGNGGNQLRSVTDAGDISKGFVDGNISGDDYGYDVNGNMIADKNKNITAITYNYLNLPQQVTKGTGEKIIYTYDAGGRKLKQQVYNSSGTVTKATEYDGEFIYQGDTLQFINHEEGRIVMKGITSPEYQYHLKDHLGNVRATFTATPTVEANTATYEDANMNVEQSKFVRYANARRINAAIFDHTNGNGQTTGYSERLSGGTNEIYGLARSISVMPGDVVSAEVYAKYVDPSSVDNTTTAGQNLLNLLAQISSSTTGVVIDGATYSSSTASFPMGFGSLVGKTDDGAPRAYLNWLVFDRNYVFITGGFKQITTAAKETGNDGLHEYVASPSIQITQPGYVYIYLSNENPTPVEVYFDDFKVTQNNSPVVQQEDFYPFGLTFNSYTRENSVPQNYLYNGKENINDLSLDWDDYGARMYMPEIGRWNRIDPLPDAYSSFSPYSYVLGNPISNTDVHGRWTVSRHNKMTMEALTQVGLGGEQAKLIAHYASVYADHPGGMIILNNLFQNKKEDYVHLSPYIDYSRTANSQERELVNGYNYNTWHSMTSPTEAANGVTPEEGMQRGLEFGWGKIFESAGSGEKLGSLKRNSDGVQALGQGLHALQDAYAHEGRSDVGMGHIWNDFHGNTGSAQGITRSALTVYKLLTNDFKGIQTDKKGRLNLDLNGMSGDQKGQVVQQVLKFLQSQKK